LSKSAAVLCRNLEKLHQRRGPLRRIPKSPGFQRRDSLQEGDQGLHGIRGILSGLQGKMPGKSVFLHRLRTTIRGLM